MLKVPSSTAMYSERGDEKEVVSEMNLEGGKYVEEKALALLGEGTAHKTPRDSVPRGAAEDAVEVR